MWRLPWVLRALWAERSCIIFNVKREKGRLMAGLLGCALFPVLQLHGQRDTLAPASGVASIPSHAFRGLPLTCLFVGQY